MGKKPETVFRQRIAPLLHKLPNSAVFPIDQTTICGDPDFFLVLNSHAVALELKNNGENPSVLQAHKLKKVEKAGGISIVATPDSWEQIYLFLQKLAQGEKK